MKSIKYIGLLLILPLITMALTANYITEADGLDYNAIQHHLKVLEKNNLIGKSGEKYAAMYFIASLLEVNMIHLMRLQKNWIKVNKIVSV